MIALTLIILGIFLVLLDYINKEDNNDKKDY